MINIQENIPLAPLTTLEVGGPARYYVRAESEEQVVEAFRFARERELPVFVLGGGSNVLISDTGYPGLVIQIRLKKIAEARMSVRAKHSSESQKNKPEIHETTRIDTTSIYLTASAGEDWNQFVARCVFQNLAGVECLSGIPGFVGGTPVQNVGAYGQEVSETIVSVRCYDREIDRIVTLTNGECGFSYRTSIFNTTHKDRYVVLAVTFRLTKNGEPKIAYKDLKAVFPDRTPTLAEIRHAVLNIRRSKSMVIDPADPNRRSAGSFFKNPIVKISRLVDIAQSAGLPEVPNHPVDKTHTKIPAAWLIEQSGFHKGFRFGNAGISTNHSLAIVNLGTATAGEIVNLRNLIQAKVKNRFGIALIPEPVMVGFA